VWVDGAPRVACVTPLRRLEGRQVTTLEGLGRDQSDRWAEALVATGGSQCGFCTPGIVMRLAALATAAEPDPSVGSPSVTDGRIDQALLAHLCRCTGWQTVREAALRVLGDVPHPAPDPRRDLSLAAERAALEGGTPQQVGAHVVRGGAGFADDTCPDDALVAVPDGRGGYALGETVAEARAAAAKIQGRSTGLALGHPVAVPPGRWALTLRTTWVEPAYVEPDASWCRPGGEPASPLANGGAFGGKRHSPVGADARRLADRHGRPVRVLWWREDVVRRGPKRPPVAVGIDAAGAGVLAVGVPPDGIDGDRWAAVVADVALVAPGLVPEPVTLAGPPVSFDLRAAVWAEAAAVAACAGLVPGDPSPDAGPVEVTGPSGGLARVRWREEGALEVEVEAGAVLDEVVLRSYCIGAAHQALGWVWSEGIAVDGHGEVRDLTVRSFGILRARDMPHVSVSIRPGGRRPAVNVSDAVFAAVAAVCWRAGGLPPEWPIRRGATAGPWGGTPGLN
jgi:aerobic-type carbon monoxide dehydrogenase small subunit (CoxS/CutS family)